MEIGPIVAEEDGWRCQVVADYDHRWTIRVFPAPSGEVAHYACWVDAILLPGFWERDPSITESGSRAVTPLIERIMAAAVISILTHYPNGQRNHTAASDT
jgi:hypothetical protein